MSNIRHECPACHACEGARHKSTCVSWTRRERVTHDHTLPVEYVHPATYRGAVDALVEIANGSRWTPIQTRARAVAALEAMGVDPYAERKVERPA
jgi:hypothetical protein